MPGEDSVSPKVPGGPPPPPRSKRAAAPNSGRRRNRRQDDGSYDNEYGNQYDGEYDDEEEEEEAPVNLMEETPETVVGLNVKVTGELAFETLLRIDGTVEGTLLSKGNLIIGETGKLVGNVENMQNMLVDGKVVGNISVEKLELHARAVVMGNITCKTLFMDHATTVVGTLNVNPFAPQEIDNEGKIKGDGKAKKKDEKKAEEEDDDEADGGGDE